MWSMSCSVETKGCHWKRGSDETPRLIVGITVDQMRADYLHRFSPLLFRWRVCPSCRWRIYDVRSSVRIRADLYWSGPCVHFYGNDALGKWHRRKQLVRARGRSDCVLRGGFYGARRRRRWDRSGRNHVWFGGQDVPRKACHHLQWVTSSNSRQD